MCLLTLQTYVHRPLCDQHWLAVYYLALSYWALHKDHAAEKLLCEWTEKPAESAACRVLKLSLLGVLARKRRNFERAEQLHKQAASEACFPTSVVAAYNLRLLGWVYADSQRWDLARQQLTAAKAVFDVHFPMSLPAASNLVALGDTYAHLGQRETAISYYQEAGKVFCTVSPCSVSAADNLNNLAMLRYKENRLQEAGRLYEEASRVYAEKEPRSLAAANCFYNFGLLQEARGEVAAARRLLEAAHSIFTLHDSERADSHTRPALARLKKAAHVK